MGSKLLIFLLLFQFGLQCLHNFLHVFIGLLHFASVLFQLCYFQLLVLAYLLAHVQFFLHCQQLTVQFDILVFQLAESPFFLQLSH